MEHIACRIRHRLRSHSYLLTGLCLHQRYSVGISEGHCALTVRFDSFNIAVQQGNTRFQTIPHNRRILEGKAFTDRRAYIGRRHGKGEAVLRAVNGYVDRRFISVIRDQGNRRQLLTGLRNVKRDLDRLSRLYAAAFDLTYSAHAKRSPVRGHTGDPIAQIVILCMAPKAQINLISSFIGRNRSFQRRLANIARTVFRLDIDCCRIGCNSGDIQHILAADHCRTSGGRVHSVSRNERIVNRTGLAGGKFNGGCCFSCALHTVCNQTEFRRRCILCWDRATDLNQDVVDFGDNSVIFSDQFYLNQVFAIPINIFLISGVVTNTQPEFQAKFAVPACWQ